MINPTNLPTPPENLTWRNIQQHLNYPPQKPPFRLLKSQTGLSVNILDVVHSVCFEVDENENENQDENPNEAQKKSNQDLENLVNFPDRGIQKILREITENELRDALKFASRKLQNKFLCNMSMTAGRHLRREIDAMENVSEKRRTSAQEAILRAVKRLKDAGEI